MLAFAYSAKSCASIITKPPNQAAESAPNAEFRKHPLLVSAARPLRLDELEHHQTERLRAPVAVRLAERSAVAGAARAVDGEARHLSAASVVGRAFGSPRPSRGRLPAQ